MLRIGPKQNKKVNKQTMKDFTWTATFSRTITPAGELHWSRDLKISLVWTFFGFDVRVYNLLDCMVSHIDIVKLSGLFGLKNTDPVTWKYYRFGHFFVFYGFKNIENIKLNSHLKVEKKISSQATPSFNRYWGKDGYVNEMFFASDFLYFLTPMYF